MDVKPGQFPPCPGWRLETRSECLSQYDTGTSEWDSSEKCRPPAWTDRVLWRGPGVQQLAYRSHQQLLVSDHKPVSAAFKLEVKVIDRTRRQKIKEEIMKKLDMLENDFLPQVMVDQTDIIFDTVSFIEPTSKTLAIANTGQVPVSFEFIKATIINIDY